MAKKKKKDIIKNGSSSSSIWSLWNDKWIIASLILVTVTKILLIPSYRSTDFDVHRNWLAITRHLPLKEWYFDDVNGTTVHTLDYPPTFAYFEYFLSNHPITNWLLDTGKLDTRCLDLLPDTDNTPSMECVTFHRFTVILSDIIYWIGSAMATTAVASTVASSSSNQNKQKQRWIYLFLILNPGLLWLDHIHFQYNGMLLGILLASLGLLIRGGGSISSSSSRTLYHVYHLLAAMLFALLLTMKHLYMTLAPFYFIYLLRTYCMNNNVNNNSATKNATTTTTTTFHFSNFIMLGFVTGCTLISPFVPFLLVQTSSSSDDDDDNIGQIQQMLSRLFPFGRGLVHDYWAANVWAFWMLMEKSLKFVGRKVLPKESSILIDDFLLLRPEPPMVAGCLLMGLVPALIYVWKRPADGYHPTNNNNKSNSSAAASSSMILNAIVFCALSSFMLGWHVHEKAIMTALIPCTLLLLLDDDDDQTITTFRLFLRMTTSGLFGLFPLLFRPIELPFKAVSYFGYLGLIYYYGYEQIIMLYPKSQQQQQLVTTLDWIGFGILCLVAFFLEVFHPIWIYPRMEFLPLMMTSITCAIGNVACWRMSFQRMMMVGDGGLDDKRIPPARTTSTDSSSIINNGEEHKIKSE